MARESDYFTAQPNMAVAAEIISRRRQACSVGPGQSEEMNNPSGRWTIHHIREGQRAVSPPDRKARIISPTPISRQIPIREAVNYASKRYDILQENVLFGVMDLVAPLPIRNPRNDTKMATNIGPNAYHYLQDATPVISRDGSIQYRSGMLHFVGESSHGSCPWSSRIRWGDLQREIRRMDSNVENPWNGHHHSEVDQQSVRDVGPRGVRALDDRSGVSVGLLSSFRTSLAHPKTVGPNHRPP